MILNVLFTSPGRRVELIEIFRKTFPTNSLFFGADYDNTSPSSFFLDKMFSVPYKIDEKYVQKVLDISITNKIDMIIPLIDTELEIFSLNRESFKEKGIFIMVSSPSSIEIARNKYKTYIYALNNNIPVPQTYMPKELNKIDTSFPIIFKPINGSSSKNIYICKTLNDLPSKKYFTDEFIIQEYIENGIEVTVDIFGTEEGKCIEAVQRKRLKVRGGEVERGVTIKDPALFKLAELITKTFKPTGVINAQFVFDYKKEEYKLIEINARFGGGYPLSYKAGANFPSLLLKMMNGQNLEQNLGSYDENIYMLRYDNAIYTKELKNLC